MSRTRIKICGLTREEDVRAAVATGADAIGFVFYPPSPRAIGFERAAQLARLLPPFVTAVGLFVNPARDFGPRLFTVVAGFRNNGLTDGTNAFWVPIAGPILGGLIGAGAYDFGVRRFLPRTP